MDNKKIGEILKRYREEAGLSQNEVAKVCGRSRSMVSRLEKGELKEIPLSFLLLYLKAIGVPKGEFFSQLEELEIKELLPEEIEKEGYPKKAKRKVIKQALGIIYQKRGVISFPEYARMRIEGMLFSIEPKEKERYLSFANDYFNRLKEGKGLELVSEKYKGLGLNFNFLRKIKKVVIKAYKRELKRAEKKVVPDEKKRKMLLGIARYQECQERIRERVKKLLFTKKGITFTHFHVYTLIAKWFYNYFYLKSLLKKGKAKLTFKGSKVFLDKLGLKKVEDWQRGIVEKEKIEPDTLRGVTEIVVEEYYKVFSKNP